MSAAGRSATARKAVRQQKQAQPKAAPKLRLVEGAKRFSKSRYPLTLISGLILILCVFVLHNATIHKSGELNVLRSEIRELEETNEGMRITLAQLEAPARITQEALRLGMNEPDTVIYLDAQNGPMAQMEIRIAADQLNSAP